VIGFPRYQECRRLTAHDEFETTWDPRRVRIDRLFQTPASRISVPMVKITLKPPTSFVLAVFISERHRKRDPAVCKSHLEETSFLVTSLLLLISLWASRYATIQGNQQTVHKESWAPHVTASQSQRLRPCRTAHSSSSTRRFAASLNREQRLAPPPTVAKSMCVRTRSGL
jgi:hypothetical protein